jgi:hypothetical protein
MVDGLQVGLRLRSVRTVNTVSREGGEGNKGDLHATTDKPYTHPSHAQHL